MGNPAVVREWDLGHPVKACRAVPLRLGTPDISGFVVAHTANVGSNPWIEMFSYPTDTLRLTAVALDGKVLWTRDLGPGVVPDHNFCPVFAIDLDGDGVDEIYFVDNPDPEHPLAVSKYRLARLDARTGELAGHWPWPPHNADKPMSQTYRYFIIGGPVRDGAVLVTAQGTYGDMYLQGWNPDMSPRWRTHIPAGSPGARGSHMSPIVDIDGDGELEFFWGERCLGLADGRERFCADQDTYDGHSDIIQPFRDLSRGQTEWRFYAIREQKNHVPPRVAVYDAAGKRLWGAVEHGHMHLGWLARLAPGAQTAAAVRIGGQTQSRAGRFLNVDDAFCFDADSGAARPLPFDIVRTYPVDIDGDGCHEFVKQIDPPSDRLELWDREGKRRHSWNGYLAGLSKFLPEVGGEQILSCDSAGRLTLRADLDAKDSDLARRRYADPFYRISQYLTGQGSNLSLVAGI